MPDFPSSKLNDKLEAVSQYCILIVMCFGSTNCQITIALLNSNFNVPQNLMDLCLMACCNGTHLDIGLGRYKYCTLLLMNTRFTFPFLSHLISRCGKNCYYEVAIIIFSTMKYKLYCFCRFPYVKSNLHSLLSLNLFHSGSFLFPTRKYYFYTHSGGRQEALYDII